MTLVSVIVPFFHKKKFFLKTIYSILSQTYKNFEIIIINDECTDSSKKFLDSIKNIDSRIKLITNYQNLGAGQSRNIGIKNSRGKYFAFIDSDDLWSKDKLKFQINFMKKNDIIFSHTSYLIINENDKIIGKQTAPKLLKFQHLINSCDIGLSSVVISSKIKKEISFPNLRIKEDYALWLRLSKKYKIYGINSFYTKWRRLNDSLSSSLFAKLIHAYLVYYKFEKFNSIKSFVLVINLSIRALIKKYNQFLKK